MHLQLCYRHYIPNKYCEWCQQIPVEELKAQIIQVHNRALNDFQHVLGHIPKYARESSFNKLLATKGYKKYKDLYCICVDEEIPKQIIDSIDKGDIEMEKK